MSNHVLCGNSLHKISLRMHVAANFSTETCSCSRARCVNNLNALHRRACNRSNFQSALVQLHSALATATATTIPLACPGCHNLYVGKTPMLVANLLPCTNKCLSQCQASVLQLMQTNVAVREHRTLPNRSICQCQRARKTNCSTHQQSKGCTQTYAPVAQAYVVLCAALVLEFFGALLWRQA